MVSISQKLFLASFLPTLIDVMDFLYDQMRDHKLIVAIFLDLRKAFDVVSPCILLEKLFAVGVQAAECKWFQTTLGTVPCVLHTGRNFSYTPHGVLCPIGINFGTVTFHII